MWGPLRNLSATTSNEGNSKYIGSAFFALLLSIEVTFNKPLFLKAFSPERLQER